MADKSAKQDMIEAINELVDELQEIADKYDLCRLCLAKVFTAYVDDLEKRGIAVHEDEVEH